MSFKEVATQVEWKVAPQEFEFKDEVSVFFDVDSYKGKVIPLPQLNEEIFTYFAEHLRRPTSRKAYWNGKRWRHPDGTNYSDVFMLAAETARTPIIRERFEAEGLGWERGGMLAEKELPFLLISLPGGVYRTKYGAKNMTFLVEYIGIENGEKMYQVTSIPSHEMNAVEHTKAVMSVVGEVVDGDPNFLISNPLVAVALLDGINKMSNLDQMANYLGYMNYQEITKLAQKSLEVEGDSFSGERRNLMVEYFAQAFYDAQSNVFYSEQKREVIQKVLADKMRYYFALEAGSELIGKTFEELREQISQNISDGVTLIEHARSRKNVVTLTNSQVLELWEIQERENWRMRILRSNEKALESYRATGCVISTRLDNGNYWNELIVDSRGQSQLNNLFGGEVRVGYESNEQASKELGDGETACYKCPVCESEGHNPGGDVKRQGSELVCQANPEKHRINYNPQAG